VKEGLKYEYTTGISSCRMSVVFNAAGADRGLRIILLRL